MNYEQLLRLRLKVSQEIADLPLDCSTDALQRKYDALSERMHSWERVHRDEQELRYYEPAEPEKA